MHEVDTLLAERSLLGSWSSGPPVNVGSSIPEDEFGKGFLSHPEG